MGRVGWVGQVGRVGREYAAEAVDGVGAEVGGDADGADEEVDAAGPVGRVRVEERGPCLRRGSST